MPDPQYKRILLKLSGEALMGDADYGIDPKVIKRLAGEIQEVAAADVQVGVVIDDHRVLASHLGDHVLHVALAGEGHRRGGDDAEVRPTRREPR